ncbi:MULTISPECIES: FadR/GntR family transcriptional regulator [Tepidibacillus]|uniref:GntR family transcriptional regulator n=1 Tax=Tepidibacillus fermentans TaxID=1281767 RepID=A0A4R3KGU2_9BACI|nr:FadR/GntR family transcriptional regulator [Tepidibacillus fermentans]TCS82558.1 GntR family transcriptional regulator [Tepidibacillus fermentans]
MIFEPIKKKRVYQIVIERIKSSVESGQLKPGDKLPSEREMAKLLQVSRSAVREALSVMEYYGMVEIKTGIGVFLVEGQIHQLLNKMNILLFDDGIQLVEVLEVRQGIESQAAYLAAKRATLEDLTKIKKALTKLEKAVIENKIAAKEDYEFHRAVVQASKNQMLMQMIYLIADYFILGLNKSRGESLKIPGRSQQILNEHKEIYDAIVAKDPNLASKKMWDHLEHVKSRFN